MLGSATNQPAQVMKAYDEKPNKMTLIKTEQEVKQEEQEQRLEQYGLQDVVKQELRTNQTMKPTMSSSAKYLVRLNLKNLTRKKKHERSS